jgi:hypothetical protein
VESVLSRKGVHNLVESRGKPFVDDEEVETEVWKWLGQQSRDFCAVGFIALVKRWDKCINICGGYVEKYMSFHRFEYHMFYVLYLFVAYLLTLSQIKRLC